jgi:spore coat-associated protein N
MSLKKKLGLGVASAALGLSLVGGGTYAYFNDVETMENNTFAAGTLDLKPEMEERVLFDISNLKPGDVMTRGFNLKNGGTLNISEVLLDATVTTQDGDVTGVDTIGDHLIVNFIKSDGSKITALSNITLNELADKVATDVSNGGIPAGIDPRDKDNIKIQIEFKDNENDQNYLQGDSATLSLSFEAKQEAGEVR